MDMENTKLQAKRKIFQFHYTTWPDHGTPDPFLLVSFHRRVTCWKVQRHGPVLVHCSAGIGRTGTFIALDALQKQGQNTGKVDIEPYVRKMRKDRMNMIQNAGQYKMLHEALIESFQWQDKSIDTDQFPIIWQSIRNDTKPLNHQKLKNEYDVSYLYILLNYPQENYVIMHYFLKDFLHLLTMEMQAN
ncbi:hypothetical protein FSP39_015473 [Pinctada imbricata]|uniref:Uncharacterized protein n=1 Tax=Pinctada imbricata TaxID=66713 RepID=A0AA88XRB9_PINIB|nr:hypothetical protein FSP39_015473 [Pinctada imbricata]